MTTKSEQVKALRNQGVSWKKIARQLDISVSKARGLFNEAPEFPAYLDGVIVKRVINPRLILVRVDGEKTLRPAIIRQGLQYPAGRKVKLEKINEKHLRVV
jgi:hypothetical protein